MANFVCSRGVKTILGATNLASTAATTFGCIPCMTNTTVDTEPDTATISAYTTLDELDDSSWSTSTRLDVGGANSAVDEGDAVDGAYWDIDNFSLTGLLNDATRDIAGILIFYSPLADLDTANDGSNIPLLWIDTLGTSPDFPFGSQGTIQFNIAALGILKAIENS